MRKGNKKKQSIHALAVNGFEIAVENRIGNNTPAEITTLLSLTSSGRLRFRKGGHCEPVFRIGNIAHAFMVRNIEYQFHIAEMIGNTTSGHQTPIIGEEIFRPND